MPFRAVKSAIVAANMGPSEIPYCNGSCGKGGAGLCRLTRACPHQHYYPPAESLREVSSVIETVMGSAPAQE